jgi:3',5'-cyclic AMP phosphodiesterase CpdA
MKKISLLGCCAVLVILQGTIVQAQNTLVPPGYNQYKPRQIPDRIVLSVTADPATSASVIWRTDTLVNSSEAQIALATGSPEFALEAQSVSGVARRMDTDNGAALHHRVTFTNLTPHTLYAYRVKGKDSWSEWFHFTTAHRSAAPFSFLYFGDAQNAIKSHFSRVIRQAYSALPQAALMLHAGDLVNSREGNHDDEWAEWCEAGSFLHAMVPCVPAVGNHECIKSVDTKNSEQYQLSPQWYAHFELPQNGPAELKQSVYRFVYQGVLFLILNSQDALDSSLKKQTAWLESQLKTNTQPWTIVMFHHPIYSVSKGRDNKALRDAWKPLFDKYKVDLVLQGHDHAYGRRSNLDEGTRAFDTTVGTMYVVSVAGPKMYLADEHAVNTMTRIGEARQLYQLVHVHNDRIELEARMADGQLYDYFCLRRLADGTKRLEELVAPSSRCAEANKNLQTGSCGSTSKLLQPPRE